MNSSIKNSAIYRGKVTHARLLPKKHSFTYDIYMLYTDLDELDQIISGSRLLSYSWSPLQFKREDFHGDPKQSVKSEVLRTVKEQSDIDVHGPVIALANWRCFGFNFNPVVFYYCFDSDGITLQALVAEVTNTPWFERHAYVLDPGALKRGAFTTHFDKRFTVSPFNPVNMQYKWESAYPAESLFVRIKNYSKDSLVFHAVLSLERTELNANSLRRILLSFPMMSLKVAVSIYWQAMKLFLKGIPFLGKDKFIDNVGSTR